MGVSVGGSAGGKSMMWQNEKIWSYPEHVISPEDDQARLYEKFVPQRVEAFLEGFPVNICCYGQTGSGKTHTMFGPPGLMERAAQGEFGEEIYVQYGLFPRAILAIVAALRTRMNTGDGRYVLTASAVELSMVMGNMDMFAKSGGTQKSLSETFRSNS